MTKIETKEQYEWALARVEQLLPLVDDNTPLTDPNSIELELLTNLVADYSDEHFSIGKPALGDVIKLRMTELGITQSKLAEILGLSPSRISDYITGKAEPTLKVARELSVKLDIAPAVVLGV
jgi:HTH-type transcriptional regulator/antitoxin HigA